MRDQGLGVGRLHPGQGVQRQAVAHGRIAGDEQHAVVAEEPRPGAPHAARQRARAHTHLQRQHVAHHAVELLLEHAAQAGALQLVVQAGVERVHIDGQAPLAPQVIEGVFVAGLHVAVGNAQLAREVAHKTFSVGTGVVRGITLVGKQRGVLPRGLAVGAPADRQRPARQLLARVPLALAKVQKAALAVFGTQLVREFGGKAAFGGAQRIGVPLGRIAVAHGHKGGLAAHGQAHIARHQVGVHLLAQGQHGLPLVFGVGLGHAGRFVDARHAHLVAEVHLGLVHAALNRCGARGLRCAGQRDVALARHQAAGGIQADPARAGQVNLAPGVQVGEVVVGAAGAIQRLHVGGQLDQVARHKPCRQPQVAQQLHQQPARVAARAAGFLQRLLGRLHAGLQADQVANVLRHLLVQLDQKVDGALLAAVDLVQVRLHQRRHRLGGQVGGQLLLYLAAVLEGDVLGLGLQEEVEGVVHRHLHHQVHRDLELARLLREDQPRLVVGKRVLLPVDEVLCGLDFERVRNHIAAAMGRRPQSDGLRPEADQPVVLVVRDVVERGVDRHMQAMLASPEPSRATIPGGGDKRSSAVHNVRSVPRCRGCLSLGQR